MRPQDRPYGKDPIDARYNDKGEIVSTKWRGNWQPGWCAWAIRCSNYGKTCDKCILLNGKRTEYRRKAAE